MYGQNLHPGLFRTRRLFCKQPYFEMRSKGCTSAAGEWLQRCMQLLVDQQAGRLRVTDDRQMNAGTAF